MYPTRRLGDPSGSGVEMIRCREKHTQISVPLPTGTTCFIVRYLVDRISERSDPALRVPGVDHFRLRVYRKRSNFETLGGVYHDHRALNDISRS